MELINICNPFFFLADIVFFSENYSFFSNWTQHPTTTLEHHFATSTHTDTHADTQIQKGGGRRTKGEDKVSQ